MNVFFFFFVHQSPLTNQQLEANRMFVCFNISRHFLNSKISNGIIYILFANRQNELYTTTRFDDNDNQSIHLKPQELCRVTSSFTSSSHYPLDMFNGNRPLHDICQIHILFPLVFARLTTHRHPSPPHRTTQH